MATQVASEEFMQLGFTDLYIRPAAEAQAGRRLIAKYLPTERQRDIDVLMDFPDELFDDIDRLHSMIGLAAKGREEFSVRYEPIRFRVTVIHDVIAGECYHLRRPKLEVPHLHELGIDTRRQSILEEVGKKRGLVLIVGGISMGKTTTAGALFKNWLTRYGGFAQIIQDVEELTLSGVYGPNGHGLCTEEMVEGDAGWEGALRRSMRTRPRYLGVNEIRSAEAACQVLRMSEAGQLVVASTHGGSIEEGLESLYQLAARQMGELAKSVLANGICGVVHQTLGRSLDMTMLFAGPSAGDPVRNTIRNGQFQSLRTIIQSQQARMMAPAAAPAR